MKLPSISRRESGQLLLPMLALLFMFGIFLASYLQWCRHKYWVLRMDVAAQATALSAARTQAELLNTLASYELAENAFVQKANFFGIELAGVEDTNAAAFQGCITAMKLTLDQFMVRVPAAAALVAHYNVADSIPIPIAGDITPDLRWQPLYVVYLYGPYPDYFDDVSQAYLARGWGPDSRIAQPDPKKAVTWEVCRRNGLCDYASARLWLDVTNDAPLVNGGFPRVNDTVLGGIGIQCFYPQFNARLVTRTQKVPFV